MPLRKLSLREIKGRPLRSLLTLLSIVIGVAAIVATSLASTSARLAQIAMVQAVTGKTALEITGTAGASFDGKPIEKIGRTPGVEIASPAIRRYSSMTIVSQDSLPSSDNSEAREKPKSKKYRIQLLGVDPVLDQKVRNYTLVEGVELTRDPKDQDHVLIDAGFAKSAGIEIGERIRFSTKSGLQIATVVGKVRANDAASALNSGLVIAPLRMVRKWCRASGKLDVVQLVLTKDAKLDEVKKEVQSRLPEGLSVRQPTMRSQVAGESTIAMQQGLRLATAFALLIAAFIIYNTFQMNVGERRRQLGILRSIGATRRQLLWMIVREGAWLGIAGTIIGCVLGYFGAAILNNSTSYLLQINIPRSPWTFWPYILAIASGLTVATMGAFFPALRAARLSPSEAMRVVSTGDFASSRVAWIIFGGVLISLSLAIQLLSITGMIDIGHAVTGAMGMIVGLVFLLPAFLSELTAWVVLLLSGVLKTEGKLARRQILRHRGRSSLTIGIVFMAMSTGLGMASTILDNIRNVEEWNQKAIVGDFFIRAAMPDMNSGQSADMPDGLPEQIAAMPGVNLVDTLRFVNARSNDSSVILVVRKFNSDTQDYFDLVEGDPSKITSAVREGKVVLGSVLSQRLNLHVGDLIPLETKDGSVSLEIAGVTNEYIAGGLTMYLESEYATRLLNVEGTDLIIIKADKSGTARLEQKLRDLSDEAGLMFQSYADLGLIIRQTLNGVVGGLWAVLILGSVIAAFGLINTLAMNILEQTREIGMLRVVAMTRWQIRKMILAQALIMGLIGIVPGVLTGVWISYMINLGTMQVTGHLIRFQVYPWLMIGAVVFELALVVIASLIPAERAARLNVSTALQYE